MARAHSPLAWLKQSENWPFIGLLALLGLSFLFGGASRADVQSLLLLRPLTALLLFFGLMTLRREHISQHRFLFGMAAAILALMALHLIPLPPSLWTVLPGRDLVVAAEQAAGIQSGWRPFTLSPAGGWNALFALTTPLAALVLGVQLTREQRFQLLPVLLIFGVLTAAIGLLQLLQGPDGPLYFYRHTNDDSPVGLFANRNHQAAFLASLFPMLGVFGATGGKQGATSRLRLWMALIFGAFLIPLLLVNGSRAGLALGLVGMLAGAWLYAFQNRAEQRRKRADADAQPRRIWLWPALATGVAALTFLTISAGRDSAIGRILDTADKDFDRQSFWPVVMDTARDMLPLGSGAGSFVEAYQLSEPSPLLFPQYLNHAHNDWLEVVMLFGIPGGLLLAIAVVAWLWSAWNRLFKRARNKGRAPTFQRLGLLIIAFMAIASIGDYPLRTPALACILVIAAIWASRWAEASGASSALPHQSGAFENEHECR